MNSAHTIHPQAAAALRAAKNRRAWGPYAARRYAEKRGALPLYVLACQLAATNRQDTKS